jgi:DnaJ-class molecular chaperone
MADLVCTKCGGNGTIRVQRAKKGPDGKVESVTILEACSKCGGTGSIPG